jgi:hypothetical protein
MDKKDEKTETESAGSCGCGSSCCHGRRCCAGKAALVLVLLVIGGLIGFCIGRCHRAYCGYHSGMVNCPYATGTTVTPPSK